MLAWSALTGRATVFTWLLVACLASDIADGVIARAFRLQSARGAALDSIADLLVTSIGAMGVWMFHREFVTAHRIGIAVMACLYAIEVAVSFLRYGRLSSFHTYLIRVSACLLGFCFAALFLWGLPSWFFTMTVVVTAAAYGEELMLLVMLPAWTPDVRGLFWIRRGPARSASSLPW